MTEADWGRCTDTHKMLGLLRDNERANDRKLRLFACACCRQIWHFVTDKRCRAAVEHAERYADGKASKKGLTPVQVEARKAVLRKTIPHWRRRAFRACHSLVVDAPAQVVASAAARHAFGAVL